MKQSCSRFCIVLGTSDRLDSSPRLRPVEPYNLIQLEHNILAVQHTGIFKQTKENENYFSNDISIILFPPYLYFLTKIHHENVFLHSL